MSTGLRPRPLGESTGLHLSNPDPVVIIARGQNTADAFLQVTRRLAELSMGFASPPDVTRVIDNIDFVADSVVMLRGLCFLVRMAGESESAGPNLYTLDGYVGSWVAVESRDRDGHEDDSRHEDLIDASEDEEDEYDITY